MYLLTTNTGILAVADQGEVPIAIIILTAIGIAIPILLTVVLIYYDYTRHKRPLVSVDPNVKYSFWHHIRVVTIPLFSYRVTFMFQKKPK